MAVRHVVAEGAVVHDTNPLTGHHYSTSLDSDSPVYGGDDWRMHAWRVIHRLPEGTRVRVVVEVLD